MLRTQNLGLSSNISSGYLDPKMETGFAKVKILHRLPESASILEQLVTIVALLRRYAPSFRPLLRSLSQVLALSSSDQFG